jgi:hypothetical protein
MTETAIRRRTINETVRWKYDEVDSYKVHCSRYITSRTFINMKQVLSMKRRERSECELETTSRLSSCIKATALDKRVEWIPLRKEKESCELPKTQ